MFWQSKTYYEFGPFRVDPRERRLLRNTKVVPLTPKVFDILLALVQNRGHLLTKDEVIRLVWPNTAVEEGNIARNISTLRNALGEHPRDHQYIETVPWRGYRFVAQVKEVLDETVAPINSIAVLPFVNLAQDPGLEYLSDGITESLINSLSQLMPLKVMSRNSVFHYKGCETEVSVAGRELNVQAIVIGRVAKHEDFLAISVEMVDVRDGRNIWGAQYTRKSADIFTIQERIVEEITGKLRLKLTWQHKQRLPQRQTQDTRAYHFYLKGRYYFNKLTVDGVQKGVEHFKQAIERDPDYALAYVGLGDCYNYWAKPNEAKQAMAKALEIDETLGEAHASLGFFKFVYDWDFDGADSQFARALALNSNYAEAHHWSAIYFANMGLHEKAAVEAKLAVGLDPLSLMMNMTPALAAYLARDYKRAEKELLKVIEMEPTFPAAHSVLGNTYLQQELYEKAMAEYQKVLELSKGVALVEAAMKAVIAHAYAKSRKRNKALKVLNELLEASNETVQAAPAINVSPHSIAEIYAALGQKDLAFDWLNRAYDQRDMQLVSLRVNPTLDPLRDDPRFRDLLRRMGLHSRSKEN
ncbi:MAG TPA: winged helix-turn-helix domain-containing protein [Pyrinomonadaceae bacterium]|jgi:TolB-like protein/Flp pilus assembly protein TadD|nr:winged helix-turn-helix domain-containing protein [Pyrinomonadaceae bacterium]